MFIIKRRHKNRKWLEREFLHPRKQGNIQLQPLDEEKTRLLNLMNAIDAIRRNQHPSVEQFEKFYAAMDAIKDYIAANKATSSFKTTWLEQELLALEKEAQSQQATQREGDKIMSPSQALERCLVNSRHSNPLTRANARTCQADYYNHALNEQPSDEQKGATDNGEAEALRQFALGQMSQLIAVVNGSAKKAHPKQGCNPFTLYSPNFRHTHKMSDIRKIVGILENLDRARDLLCSLNPDILKAFEEDARKQVSDLGNDNEFFPNFNKIYTGFSYYDSFYNATTIFGRSSEKDHLDYLLSILGRKLFGAPAANGTTANSKEERGILNPFKAQGIGLNEFPTDPDGPSSEISCTKMLACTPAIVAGGALMVAVGLVGGLVYGLVIICGENSERKEHRQEQEREAQQRSQQERLTERERQVSMMQQMRKG